MKKKSKAVLFVYVDKDNAQWVKNAAVKRNTSYSEIINNYIARAKSNVRKVKDCKAGTAEMEG